jgi:hypothetical protein
LATREKEHPYVALKNTLLDEFKFKKLEPFKPGRAVGNFFPAPKPMKNNLL